MKKVIIVNPDLQLSAEMRCIASEFWRLAVQDQIVSRGSLPLEVLGRSVQACPLISGGLLAILDTP